MKITWIAGMVVALLAVEVFADEYEIVRIGGLGGIGGTGKACDINAHGQVVGRATNANGDTRPFVWTVEHGIVELPLPLGATRGQAVAINDSGWIVGHIYGPLIPWQATLWRPGYPPLVFHSVLGGTRSYPASVNNSGQVVGTASTSGTGGHDDPFLWSAIDGVTDMGVPSGTYVTLKDINDAGQIVGDMSPPGGPVRAFVWTEAGGFSDVYPDWPTRNYRAKGINSAGDIVGLGQQPGDKTTPVLWPSDGSGPIYADTAYGWAEDINDEGMIVGKHRESSYSDPDHAFVWDGGDTLQTLPMIEPDGRSYAEAINNDGWIVGWGTDSGHEVALVWIPETDTLTWDGTDPAGWTGAHWNPGPVAPSGGEPMVVDSGTVTISSDLSALPAASLAIARYAAGGTVSIGPTGQLLVTGEVTVGAGGTLSIDGMLVARLVTVSGGTLTSDAGAGTGAIDGSLTLTDGATFAVEATGVGMDRLDCTGAVTIDPSASLDITLAGFPGPALGMAMPLIGADGGLAGTFGTVNGVLLAGNKACAVTYQANGATVTVVRPGDFEVDGDVDFSDFTYLAANYGQSGKTWVDGDADGNGTVNFADFTHLAANYGTDYDSSAEAPSSGTVELHVDVTTGEMRLVGNAATLSGYSITSAAGSLVPDGDGNASPFQAYLANLAGDVSAASLGVGVLVDAELALDAGYDTAGAMDLAFSYGVFGQGGSVSGQVVTVPEPTCVALLALGALAMLRHTRRR